MRILVTLFTLVACASEPEPGECLPTLGDHCSCEPACLTQRQIDKIDSFCDLACDSDAEALDWACTVVDGACAAVP